MSQDYAEHLASLTAIALSHINQYGNITVAFGRCPDGCGNTLTEIYRLTSEGEDAMLVARGHGANVMESLILADADLQHKLTEHYEREQEIEELEALFSFEGGDA